MQLVEYVNSLFEQGLSGEEVIAKTQEWKKKNNYGASEQPSVLKEDLKPKEEVKIDDVAGKKDATVTSTSDASKAIEKITGQSKFGTGPSALPDPKQSFDLVGRTAEQVSGITPIFKGVDLNPGETKTANNYEYKYEISEDKQPVFYTKPEGQEDWINVTANKAKNPGAELGVAEELGFNVGDFDREKALSQRRDREDFNIGDYLNIDKNKDEVVIFDASNIKGLTKDGEMLTAEELFFKNKAKPARYADSFVDENFEEKELQKQNKKSIESKLKDYVVANELNLNNKYERFKDQEYSGEYKEDFNPDAAVITINNDYNANALSGVSNFNYNDFVGFYNNKGYSEDYFDNVMNPNQGYDVVEISIKQKLESETDPTAIKSLKDQLKSSKTNRQRYLNDRLNNYIDEKEDEYAKKLYSAYILKNPEKFKDIKSTDKAFAKAKKYFDDKYGEFGYGLFNYNEIEAYKKLAFPELTAANAEALAVQQQKINRIKSENTLGSDLYLAAKKAARGYMSGAQEIATGIQDIFGIDNTYQRSVIEERDIKRQAEDVGYQFVMGKEAIVDGITYIKDEVGNIYDTTNKTILGSVSEEKFKKINEALDNSKETGSSFSAIGSLQEFAAVGGRMAYDIIGTSLTGGASKALGITKLTNALRIPEATVGAMGYYGASGYFGTKQNTYNQFIKAGVNEADAGEMSDLAARYGAALYALTSAIAPNSKYVDNLNTNLFGTSTTSRLIKDAINGYKKKGVSGAGVSIFKRLKRFVPTKQGVVSTVSDGVFEVGQETLQQGLEIYGLNPYLNKLAEKDILQETMTGQDFANLWMTSFGSGSVFANLNLRGFGPRNAGQQLQSLYQIGQDLSGSRKIMNGMVVSGDITTEQMSQVLSDVRAVHNQMNKIPGFVSDETKLESAKLQQEIADLQEKKKRTSEAYQPAIDELINKKKQELAEIVKPELEKMAARKGAKKAAEQLGAGFENFSTQQDMDSAAESLTEDGWEVQDSTGYGMALTKGKQKIILVNDQAAAEDNRYTTDQHEVLHPFWEAALKANPEAAISLGKALMVEIINNKDINAGTELLSRFSGYLSDENYSAENTWEEVIPLVSEALSNGDITYNKKQESWWKNLGTKISNFLKGNKKPLSLEFNTGKDVFEFIKGYNKTIEAGKGLTKEQLEVAEKGAKGKLIEEGFDQESTYTVKEGETIQDVANKFDTTVQNLKDLNKTSGVDLKAGDNLIVDRGVKIVERASEIKAAQQIKESVAKESKRKLTPEQDKQAQDKVKEIQELQKESEALAKKYKKYKKDSEGNVLKDKQGNPVLDVIKGAKQQRLETELAADIKPTVDSFVESRTKALYDPIPADNKRNVTRQEFVESMKSDINAMIVGEFKAKQPLEKFITSRGFVRANSLAQRLGIKPAEQGIDQDIDTASNITTKTDDDVKTETETRTAQLPRATTQFTPDFVANLDVNAEGKTEAEVNEEIQKQFDEAIAKDLEAMGPVTTFGQTKDIGPALAALMEKATQGRTEKVVKGEKKIVKTPGIPAKVFMEKSKNIAKKYATSGALTAVKQYLDANAQRDFNNLPDAFAPGTGKATFIPENVKKALYKKNDKNQFVLDKSKTLADYKALLGDMTKPVYRASEAQTIKGLIALSLRNRIFEQAVPDAVERSVTGVKFSKRIQQSLPKATQSQVQNIGKAISGLEDPKIVSRFTNSIDAFIDAIAVDDYNVEAAFNEVYGAEFLTKKNGDPTAKKTNLINEWIKVRQSGKGLKDFVKQTPSEITMRDYLYQAFEEQTESEVVENILGIKKGGVNFRSKDQIMGYVNLMNNYIASKYGKLSDKEIAEFVINELGPSLSAGAKVAGNDFMWKLNQDTGLLALVPSTIDGRKDIRPSIFANQRQMSEVLIKPFLSESGKNKLTYKDNTPLWEGKPLKKGQVSQKVSTYTTSIKKNGEISKGLLDKSADFAQQKIETIVDFLNWYKSQGKNTEITVDMLGMAFRAFNGDMTALVRAAARVDSFAGDGTGPQRYEHNPPARTMLVRMAEYVNGNITEQELRDYFSNYTVSIIPELMDDVINERYKDTSPLIGSRYYNAFTYGRFPFAMTKYKKQEDGSYEKTTIGEYQKEAYKNANKIKKANIGVAPKALMSKRATNQEIINDLGSLDGALNQARRPDAPVKKIRVFDFDDTLARSKSKVLYTVPNVEGGFSEGATKLKAIFMVGGPGAGKTNVGKGLQLGRRGYKVVNQDIALEAMKAESGLPAKESDYTAEQRSLRSKLGAAARKAAVAKFDKYAAAGNGMVIDGTGASYNATTKKIKALQDQGFEVHMVVATTPLETAIERNKARTERSLPDFVVKKTYESVQESLKKYREDFGNRLYEINTETIEYGKPLPNEFLQQVYDGINTNKVGKVDATSFAENYDVLESQGAEFDFREFSKVIEGKKGPLFSVAEKIAAARGTDDVFILTARPADAAKPIQEFMKANGIDIPLQNITGLGDGTAAAKGRWIAGKAAEGYNDFYFADDAVKNVQAVKEVLSQVDVKSKVQQAKASKRITFDKVFNDIIEQKTGIERFKQYSAAKAKTVGASKGKFTFFTTPSAEDFLGLLYKTLGKGKVGDAQMAFYKTNLIDPYNRAEMAISQAKVAAGRDYKALKKQFKSIPKTLEKETGIAKYTYQHAIRTYIWDSQGLEVPGLSKRDQKRLTDFIKADPELQAFADQLVTIQKGKPYPKPDKDWTAGNITTDVISGINKVNRAEYLQEWQENVDIIFSEKNMNKLEAAFGAKYVEALKDSLRAMKSGSNRPLGGDRVSNGILDWLNNSVGAIMFLNTRSAVLQTISAVNFINWGDNNILKAGKAFANQKQFWGDFLTLMNSDYLLERRDGLKINVSESEIADAVEGSKNKVNAAISFLLNKGFVFTRYADSFAIASGGATFYRNRIESLVEQGMDRKAAEQQAFEDFRLIAEENQQSSSPMRISQQQRSLIGRIILQFGNTQLQYVRIQKRAVQDLVNKRGDWKSNISKIVYYGAIQNLLFNAMQSGLAWALFDDDEEDEKLTEENKEQKLQRTLNGAIDSQLKGLGIQGAVVAGVKNALITIAEQADKKSPKFEEALDDLLSIAPSLGSKIRKIKSAARTVSWNRKEIKEKGFSMDNPAYLAGAQVISAALNIPLDRAVMKMNNMRNILNPATENWQKVALALGWSGWDVGLPYFGLAEDKPVLTETEKQSIKLFDLNKSDQVKMLLDLGLTKKQIRALTKEEDRVKEIIKLQNKKKDGK